MGIKYSRLALTVAVVVVTLAAWSPLLPGQAAAATPAQSITITPTSVDTTINPGASHTGQLQVINTGSQSFSIKIYATPYNVSGEEYHQSFTALPGKPNIVSWFKFPLTGAQVTPNQTQTIPYTIAVPANTPPGGYYATVFAETLPSASQSKSGVILHQRVGTIFYLQVGGTAHKKGSLDGWQASVLQTTPLTAHLRVKNDGDVHFVANTNVVVRDIFGTPKFTLSTAREVLPRTIRQIDVNWPKAPPIGVFKVSGSVQLLGHTSPLPTKYVLIVSWPVRIGIIVLILAAVTFVVLRRRHVTR